jgi:DNA-binding NarL/FixJ family response regulator
VSAVGSTRPIRVVIADDHEVVRDGLRALVNAQPGLEVVGEARDGQEAWQKSCALAPDVLVLDVSMPRVGGTEATERISRDCPGVKVVALTMHEERGYVLRLLKAGAAGYVLKRAATADLVQAIHAVVEGRRYVDPSLAGELLGGSESRRPDAASIAGLTDREREVLRLLALGHSNKGVAADLEISVKTVETHRANGMHKLGLTSRVALVRFAAAEGWLQDV